MKKMILALVTVASLGLAGCQAKPDTQAIENEMTSAIQAKHYDQAAGLNEAILKLDDSDSAASKRAKQFTKLLDAQTQFNRNDFAAAKNSAAKVGTGDKQLLQVANQLEAKANERNKQQTALRKQLSAAEHLISSNPSAAQAKLKFLLAEPDIKLTAFRSLRIKALQLQNELLTTSAVSSTTNDSSSSSAHSASSSSSAASSSSSSTQPEGQPVSGSEDISAADISKARQEIKAAGEDPSYFSDNDVRSAIIKAHAAGRTVIQASDWQ